MKLIPLIPSSYLHHPPSSPPVIYLSLSPPSLLFPSPPTLLLPPPPQSANLRNQLGPLEAGQGGGLFFVLYFFAVVLLSCGSFNLLLPPEKGAQVAA